MKQENNEFHEGCCYREHCNHEIEKCCYMQMKNKKCILG